MMDVLAIVETYLKQNGYDGLCNTVGECGCSLNDGGINPCCEMTGFCRPAYKGEPPPEEEYYGGHSYWMYSDAADARKAWHEKDKREKERNSR